MPLLYVTPSIHPTHHLDLTSGNISNLTQYNPDPRRSNIPLPNHLRPPSSQPLRPQLHSPPPRPPFGIGNPKIHRRRRRRRLPVQSDPRLEYFACFHRECSTNSSRWSEERSATGGAEEWVWGRGTRGQCAGEDGAHDGGFGVCGGGVWG
jgi:hypothetical protein